MFVPAMVRVESAPLPVFLCRIHVDYCFCGLLEPSFGAVFWSQIFYMIFLQKCLRGFGKVITFASEINE